MSAAHSKSAAFFRPGFPVLAVQAREPLGGEVQSVSTEALEACMALTIATLDPATAARINPLISDISQKDTLATAFEFVLAWAAEHGIATGRVDPETREILP